MSSSQSNSAHFLSLCLTFTISELSFSRNLVRHSISRVIAVIAFIEVPQNTWPALLPFLQQSCTSQQVVHREVGSYILFTVLESIVTGFQEHLSGLFDLFRGLLVDPESSEVRITTVRYQFSNFQLKLRMIFFFRALGVIAQYLDVEDKNEVVCLISLPICISILIICLRNHIKLFSLP
jgi:hypothetical protein